MSRNERLASKTTRTADSVRLKLEQETFALRIQKVIGPELLAIYRKHEGCNL